MPRSITASMLYDWVQCPHRVYLDIYGDAAEKKPESVFVKMLWERGLLHEEAVIGTVKHCDLSAIKDKKAKREATLEAMKQREPLIYNGAICYGDLEGVPDLLRHVANGLYEAGDIKSGKGLEGNLEDGTKPKRHYAMQLALYTDVLEQLGKSAHKAGFIWDAHGAEVPYQLLAPISPKRDDSATYWDLYRQALHEVRKAICHQEKTTPAYSSGLCKLCHWYTFCLKQLEQEEDLTLLPELGRTKRDALVQRCPNISALAKANIPSLLQEGSIPGVSEESLLKFQKRARLQTALRPRPYTRETLNLPESAVELFFDVETDPFKDICYLHGFLERNAQTGDEVFYGFFADTPTPEDEEKAFYQAWQYVLRHPDAPVYFYSKYERTTWYLLQKKYPGVCTSGELKDFFASPLSIDLYYDIVKKHTEWPTRDFSIKTLATFLGFKWRDTDPSGASSIEWFHSYTQSQDLATKQRILDYNEDDCRATRILLDGLKELPLILDKSL